MSVAVPPGASEVARLDAYSQAVVHAVERAAPSVVHVSVHAEAGGGPARVVVRRRRRVAAGAADDARLV